MKEYVIEDGVIKIKFNTRQKGYVTVLFDIQDEEFVSNNKIRLKYDKTIEEKIYGYVRLRKTITTEKCVVQIKPEFLVYI